MAEPVNGLLRRQPVLNGLLGPARMNPNLQAQGRNALASLRGTPSPFLDPEFYTRDLGPSAASYFSDPENALRALSVAPVPVLSDVAGLAADALMYKNKPESRNMLNFGLTGVGLLPFIPALATAYHGSPYKFDKFDAAHIGKGEGAQAYGHGTYFAEAPAVAKQYADTLGVVGAGDKMGNKFGKYELGSFFEEALKKSGVPDGAAKSQSYAWADKFIAGQAPNHPIAQSVIAEKGLHNLTGGSLYKVDIPDEYIPRMLDWDKPLSQQADKVSAAVQKVERDRLIVMMKNKINARAEAIKSGGNTNALDRQIDVLREEIDAFNLPIGGNGEYYYKTLSQKLGGDKAASEYLNSIGISGIRYLDGGSRGTGQGTSNFVVFPGNEGAVKILERK